MTEEKIFSNLHITDAELLEKIDQYMKDNPDSVVPVDEAQIARITELVKDVKIDEETKPDQKEETPHMELQIQWHEDKLHSLRTREPMREWEFRRVLSDGAVSEWRRTYWPGWMRMDIEYRRKPRTVTYWHCVCIYKDALGDVHNESFADTNKDIIECRIKTFCSDFKNTKFGPITETTVELED